jgi:hypothetical protein
MMTATKTAKKIQLLQALIDHPRTGDEEREAGRRMLARLLAKASTSGEKITATGWTDHRTYGAKYATHRTYAETAKLMRADIKLARKIGLKAADPGSLTVPDPIADAPAAIKFSVRTETFSGGGAIDITISNIPEGWGYTTGINERGRQCHNPTPALAALADELRAIHQAYNYNGSDPMTDYFDVAYYGGVRAEGPSGSAMSI